MLEKLTAIEQRYEELNQQLAGVGEDYQRAAELNKERIDLEPLVTRAGQYRQALEHLEEAHTILEGDDAEMRLLAEAEILDLEPLIEQLESEIKSMLLPSDPRDGRNVIMEIRAGTGGDEAAIFAADLFRLYTHYAEARRWTIEILSTNEIGIGGYKEIIFMVKGRGAYSRLKYESGVHRVQRVPVTESQGRIHTSAVTIAVMPEAEEVDIDITPDEIRVDVFRSSGPGGQSVNTTDSAVRITHLPTGLIVSCQDEKSQLKNKAKALKVLRARLLDRRLQEQNAELSAQRKAQVGSGDRSGRIRTYNYPQNRLTDHRINLTIYSLEQIMDGKLDALIDPLITAAQDALLQQS